MKIKYIVLLFTCLSVCLLNYGQESKDATRKKLLQQEWIAYKQSDSSAADFYINTRRTKKLEISL